MYHGCAGDVCESCTVYRAARGEFAEVGQFCLARKFPQLCERITTKECLVSILESFEQSGDVKVRLVNADSFDCAQCGPYSARSRTVRKKSLTKECKRNTRERLEAWLGWRTRNRVESKIRDTLQTVAV